MKCENLVSKLVSRFNLYRYSKGEWEMKDEEIIVRITMEKPAKKTDLKVVFGANKLTVVVFGETIIDGKLAGTVHGDESTWWGLYKLPESSSPHSVKAPGVDP